MSILTQVSDDPISHASTYSSFPKCEEKKLEGKNCIVNVLRRKLSKKNKT